MDEGLLRELLGEAELRELLDPDCVAAVEEELQQLPERLRARSADGVHDLLLRLGDLERAEIARRSLTPAVARQHRRAGADPAGGRGAHRRAQPLRRRRARQPLPGRAGHRAAARAARGVPPARSADPLGELLLRYARTHGPFAASAPAARLGLQPDKVQAALHALAAQNKLVEGAFRRGETDREWCDPEILRTIRRRSLARLRQEVEPVEPAVLARFITRWQGVTDDQNDGRAWTRCWTRSRSCRGCRCRRRRWSGRSCRRGWPGYLPGDIDALAAAGEIVWVGVSPLGPRDGRVALYLTDGLPSLHQAPDLQRLVQEGT